MKLRQPFRKEAGHAEHGVLPDFTIERRVAETGCVSYVVLEKKDGQVLEHSDAHLKETLKGLPLAEQKHTPAYHMLVALLRRQLADLQEPNTPTL